MPLVSQAPSIIGSQPHKLPVRRSRVRRPLRLECYGDIRILPRFFSSGAKSASWSLPFSSVRLNFDRSLPKLAKSSALIDSGVRYTLLAALSTSYFDITSPAWSDASPALWYLRSLCASVWTGLLKLPPTRSGMVKGSSLKFPAPCCSSLTSILISGIGFRQRSDLPMAIPPCNER